MGTTEPATPAASAGQAVDEHVRGLPAAGLRTLIADYSGYRQGGVMPGTHRGLPSPFLTLIFTLDEPLRVAGHPDPGQPAGSYDSLAGGLHTAPALITHDGWQSGVQLGVSPLGARALFGMPAGELAGIDVDAADLLGSLAAEVRERLQEADTWPRKFAILDEVLLARATSGRWAMDGRAADGPGAGGPAPGGEPAPRGVPGWSRPRPLSGISPEVGYAWGQLLAAGGLVSVAELAAETGWSERHLRSQFRIETGLTPKAAARVIRFDRARRRLQRLASAGDRGSLAALAADCGYYDQAHLDREFRALAGCPPTRWLAEEFRNVQAGRDDPLAGS